MASEPIRSTSVEAAPKDYSIPNAQQIRLLSVTASFTDNGAGGDWLPAVVILDNNGNALVRAVDQAVKVTAGSDAEVSWFPGVKSGGGAAGSPDLAACTTSWDTAAGVIPNGTNTRGLTGLAQDAAGAFTSLGPAPNALQINLDGCYLIHGVLALSSRAALIAPLAMLVTNVSAPFYSQELWDAPLDAAGKASFGQMEGAIIANAAAGDVLAVKFTNSGGAIGNVDHISLACIRLSSATIA